MLVETSPWPLEVPYARWQFLSVAVLEVALRHSASLFWPADQICSMYSRPGALALLPSLLELPPFPVELPPTQQQ
jgi:hypothetical protein